MEDGNTPYVAHAMPELLDGLEQITEELRADLAEREERVKSGPDAHLWRK